MIVLCTVVHLHDLQSEGLSRRLCIDVVETAGAGRISRQQATWLWDQTILPLGKRLGLLTGYVKTQAGSSKRTAAGAVELQRKWHETIDKLFAKIRARAKEVLVDDDLVEKMLPHLVFNLDEECLHALGKNSKVIGAKTKKKHDNQNASSRFVAVFFFSRARPIPWGCCKDDHD